MQINNLIKLRISFLSFFLASQNNCIYFSFKIFSWLRLDTFIPKRFYGKNYSLLGILSNYQSVFTYYTDIIIQKNF